MYAPIPFLVSVLRAPAPAAHCNCEHWVYCVCGCHGRHCDPSKDTCDIAFLPDDGGFTYWGCPSCTPGVGALHFLGCELIGWNVSLDLGPNTDRVSDAPG